MPDLLHERLERTAGRTPEAIAVVDGERAVTYRELFEAATGIAATLSDHGVGPGDRVALWLDKSVDAIAAVYGVLGAGAAYVPIDPSSPLARAAYVVRDCGVRWVVSTWDRADTWDPLTTASSVEGVLALGAPDDHDEGTGSGVVAVRSPGPPTPAFPTTAVTGDGLAYVLYTSGSTGDPKGVMLSHRNATAFVDWAVDTFAVGASDRLSSHAPLHFDLSVFDLYAASTVGAALVLVPPRALVFPAEAAALIDRAAVTVWYSVPSALIMLLRRGLGGGADLSSLRLILFAGEVFPTKYLRRLRDALPDVGLANLYGPTETNVCTYHVVRDLPADDDVDIPIGVAIDGVELRVLAADGSPTPPGDMGELWVSGPTVMHGYWGDDAKTADRLRVLPEADPERGPSYRTGDLVRLRPDGALDFVGRADHQVKSRGYRIELGEIEAVLGSHPAVESGAVVAVPDETITNRLVAYVALIGAGREGANDGDAAVTRSVAAHLGDRLPRYMVPERIEILDAMPVTSTGKLDRQALAVRARRTTSDPAAEG